MRHGRVALPLLGLGAVILVPVQALAQGWYDSDWTYRKPIAIQGSEVGATGAPHAQRLTRRGYRRKWTPQLPGDPSGSEGGIHGFRARVRRPRNRARVLHVRRGRHRIRRGRAVRVLVGGGERERPRQRHGKLRSWCNQRPAPGSGRHQSLHRERRRTCLAHDVRPHHGYGD